MCQNNLLKITNKATTFFLLNFCLMCFEANCVANQPSVQDIILKMEQNFSKIENYQVNVSRIYYHNEVLKSREEWRFIFQNPGLARLEVMLPKKIILVINQNDAWQCLLEEKKVARRKIRDLKEKERLLLIGKMLKPYEIEGWGLFISSKFGDRLKLMGEEVVRGRKCYLIECKPQANNPQQLKLLVWIDQERRAVVRRELYKEDNHLVKKTESGNFLEVIPGIWLPRRVESNIQTDKGEVIKQLVLRNIKRMFQDEICITF